MRIALLGLCCVWLAGCSQTLGFNFKFGSDDFDNGSLDLAMVSDQSVGDLPPVVDGASSDQSIHDLGAPDQAVATDLAAAKDLFGADLRTVDMVVLNTLLGKECSLNSTGSCGTLTCMTMYPSAPDAGSFTNGYCTKECASEDPCLAIGGHCLPVGGKKYCLLSCTTDCARGDNSCCDACTTTASGTTCSPKVCVPTGVPGFCQ